MSNPRRTKKWIEAEKLFSTCESLVNILIFQDKNYDDFQLELNRIYSEVYNLGDAKELLEKSQKLYDFIIDKSEISDRIKKAPIEKVMAFTEEYRAKGVIK